MPRTLPLTKSTLNLTRNEGQKGAVVDLIAKVAQILDIDQEPPFVGLVKPLNPQLIGGRFFPREKAILVYENENPEVIGATIAHELTHWANYVKRCGGVPRTHKQTAMCNYVGQHDRKFYDVLETVHRTLGVSTKAARQVEGRYSYPAHWRAASWS